MQSHNSIIEDSLTALVEKEEINPDYFAGPLSLGYCRDRNVLDAFSKWHKEEYPSLEANTPPEKKDYVSNLAAKVEYLSALDVSQDFLSDNLKKYLKKYSPDQTRLMAVISEGVCSGLAFFVTDYIKKKLKRGELIGDILQQLEGFLHKLSTLDMTGSLSLSERQEIEDFIKSTCDPHYSRSRLSLAQADWHKMSDLKFIEATAVEFQQEKIKKLVGEFFAEESNAHFETYIEALYLQASDHASVVIKLIFPNNASLFFYFDPNGYRLLTPMSVAFSDILAGAISVAHHFYPNTKPFLLTALRFSSLALAPKLTSRISVDMKIERLSKEERHYALLALTLAGVESATKVLWEKMKRLSVGHKNFLNLKSVEPITFAARACQTKMVRLFLTKEFSQNVNACTIISGRTAMHFAALFGSLETMEVLVKNGANLNPVTKMTSPKLQGWTPLAIAAKYGRVSVVEFLISHKANLELKTGDKGKTPLLIAIESNQLQIARLLIQAGANLFATSHEGETILNVASSRELSLFVLITLEARLLRAVRTNNLDLAVKAVTAGADVNLERSKTFLHIAAERGHAALVDFLLVRGANPNAKTREDETAFDLAVKNDHVNVVQQFIKNKVPGTQQAFAAAIEQAKVKVVKCFLKERALQAEAVREAIPLHLAKTSKMYHLLFDAMVAEVVRINIPEKRAKLGAALLARYERDRLQLPFLTRAGGVRGASYPALSRQVSGRHRFGVFATKHGLASRVRYVVPVSTANRVR